MHYRYGYQGEFAETDSETAMPAFELRLWDARIGRWLTTDPARQYDSPYLGMGNNPVSMTDSDGGKADCTNCDPLADAINTNLGISGTPEHTHGGYANSFFESFNSGIVLDGITLGPESFFFSFNAERQANSFRIDGTLSLMKSWLDKEFEVNSWEALSGSRTLLPIPNGTDWQLSNLRYRDGRGDNNNTMTRDGVGFSVDITPDPRHGRTLLRVHPDGGLTGTEGCIGLTCGAEGLTAFENTIEGLLEVHTFMRLEVNGSYHGPDGGWPVPANNVLLDRTNVINRLNN